MEKLCFRIRLRQLLLEVYLQLAKDMILAPVLILFLSFHIIPYLFSVLIIFSCDFSKSFCVLSISVYASFKVILSSSSSFTTYLDIFKLNSFFSISFNETILLRFSISSYLLYHSRIC